MGKQGIDISEWQGSVNFNKVKADGIQFCIFREGYRRAIDSQFKNYVKGAKAAGIPILGVYHFIYIDGATPKQNAEACIANMKAAGLDPTNTWIFADLEYDTWTKAGIKVTKALCTQYTIEFLSTLKAAGCKKLGIYCNLDYYRNYYDWNQLGEYRKYLWLADYTGGPDVDCVIQQTGSTGKVSGISGNVDMDKLFDESMLSGKEETEMGVTAQDVLNVMRSWIGYSEANGRYLEILNIYNSHKPLARGYAIKPSDEWCDATVSAAAIKAGAVDLIGTEVGVEKHVDIFKKKGIWIEDGSIKPQAGDIIVFNWDDSSQPNDGWSDHIGYVEQVSGNTITCIEGNMSKRVGRRTINVGWGYIRGFARPKYAASSGGNTPSNPTKSIDELAKEVIIGLWGNGDDRKQRLTAAGYSYSAVQNRVNEMLNGSKPTTPQKSIDELAKEVIAGKWGNGDARKQALTSAGYDYNAVQTEVNRILVNRILGGTSSKSVITLAQEVIQGKWGNCDERKQKLESAGYNYAAVQAKVNELLGSGKSIDELAREVIQGKWGNGNERKQRLTQAGYDYDKVQARVNQLL